MGFVLDLKARVSEIIVIDARSRDAYAAGHIPGATSFPHLEMSAETTARLDRSKVYVVYATESAAMHQPRARTNSLGWSFAPRSCRAASIGRAAMDTPS
jgi:hypothetical protein